MTREEKSNKLHEIFRKKFREIKSNEYAQNGVFNKLSPTELTRFDQISNKVSKKIEEYMSGLRPHVRIISVGSLWRLVNEGLLDAVALEDPSNLDRVIVVNKEYADKVLVLGLP